MKKCFGIAIEPVIDSLCPTIANRFEYVCWMRELAVLHHLRSIDDILQAPKDSSLPVNRCIDV